MRQRTSFGQYIRSRRVKAGLTFRALSGLTGLTPTLIFNIEKGRTDPKLSHIKKLAKAFGDSVAAFVGKYES